MKASIIMGIITIMAIFTAGVTMNKQLQAQTNDPFLNNMFAVTDMLMMRLDPNNNQFKDQEWSVPTSQQASLDLCASQAEQMGVYDIDAHCSALSMECGNKQLTGPECYTYLMYGGSWETAPKEVVASMQTKLDASAAATQAQYEATMCPASDGTYGSYC